MAPLLLTTTLLLLPTILALSSPQNQSTFFSLVHRHLSGAFLSHWNSSLPFCSYTGVSCDPRGHVAALHLADRSLSGSLPPDLCLRLPSLRSLRLDRNDLSGPFPSSLLNCTSLEELTLSSASLSGPVPDLSLLSSLRLLDLSGNLFSGAFPTSVFNLTPLEWVNFNENRGFDTWYLPETVSRLPGLRVLILSSSALRGDIPEWIGNATSLTFLQLAGNYLVGRVPAALGRLRNLQHLELYYNLLDGPIPGELGNLTALVDLDMSVNRLTGGIPEPICRLPNLRVLQLYNNSLTGGIPPAIGNSTALTTLSVYKNFLTGELPPGLGLRSGLVVLELSENRLSGGLPRHACARGRLQYLLLLGNLFSGRLPEEYSTCETLLRFRVGDNRLNGRIPGGLLGLRHVSIVDLGYNRFEGPFPASLGRATNLSAFFLQSNLISGPIPPEISGCANLVKLDLSRNALSGPIPPEIGGLRKLNLLSLQGNRLVGGIPPTLAGLRALNVLNLSGNLLSGKIPESLCELLPNSLDFSNNCLSGPIPVPLLRGGLGESFARNPGLCLPVRVNLPDVDLIPMCPGSNARKRIGGMRVVLVSVGIGVAGVLLLVRRLLARRRVVSEHDGLLTSPSYSYDMTSFHKVSFDQNEIVKALVDKNKVGHGGSGTVYKIKLSNGEWVAVKKIWTRRASKGTSPDDDAFSYLDCRELRSEVDTLGSIRHKNIVKLYCCFSNSDSNLLVYEYMPNGNLWDALHGGWGAPDWSVRCKIARGTAQGLAYLHHDLLLPIVHRDIKTSNILLDADYEPKVADFGIAKVLRARGEDSSTMIIAGTYGYLAPEYAYSSKATTKCDVYSFGVVLMELVTGRRPREAEFGESKDIVHWVSARLATAPTKEGAADEVLDRRLSRGPCREEMAHVLRIALRCTCAAPALRPSMNDVVQMLLERADPCGKPGASRPQQIKHPDGVATHR